MTEIFANDHRCKRRSKMDIDYVDIGSMMMAILMLLKIPIMMMMMMMKMVLKILHSTLMSFGFFSSF